MHTDTVTLRTTLADVADARHILTASRDRLLQLCSSVNDSSWTAKPNGASWSVADHVEHLALLEELFTARLIPKLLASAAPPADRDLRVQDARVLEWDDPERTRLGQAPPPLQPSGRWTGAEALRRFVEARAATVAWLDAGHDLRIHALEHPAAGLLDGYQWLLFVAAHTDRHARQIQRSLAGSAM